MAPRTDKPPVRDTGSVPVVVSVPADKTYVVLIRSAVSHLGARLGFTVAEITDLRLAVDEACGLLLASDDGPLVTGASLRCQFEEMGDALRVTVSADVTQHARPDTEGFGWSVLSALVDSLSWSMLDGTGHVELVKRPARQEGR
jgi:serine/threonine-protein kinase RsbW